MTGEGPYPYCRRLRHRSHDLLCAFFSFFLSFLSFTTCEQRPKTSENPQTEKKLRVKENIEKGESHLSHRPRRTRCHYLSPSPRFSLSPMHHRRKTTTPCDHNRVARCAPLRTLPRASRQARRRVTGGRSPRAWPLRPLLFSPSQFLCSEKLGIWNPARDPFPLFFFVS